MYLETKGEEHAALFLKLHVLDGQTAFLSLACNPEQGIIFSTVIPVSSSSQVFSQLL